MLRATAAAMFMLGAPATALAQSPARVDVGGVVGARLQGLANGVLGMLGYSVAPGVAASSIQINRGTTGNPSLTMGQIGSGFTIDPSFPLYMEGYLGYSRYDPKFVFSDGSDERQLPTRWNSVAATIGLGWDFQLNEHWVLRPIINGMMGYVASDATLVGLLLEHKTNADLQFLTRGHLNAVGIGGSLVLAYYLHREAYEFDMELRSTNLYLTSFGDTAQTVRGEATAISTSLWTRLRWPTGVEVFRRPLRWVVEGTHSELYGGEWRALGFNRLTSIGGGLEVDLGGLHIGALGLEVQRIRVTGKYFFGPQVSGAAAGIGISF
jgi:hypothetical protein